MSTSKNYLPYFRTGGKAPAIVYGPQGCGMSKLRNDLANYLGVDLIIDDWDGSHNVPANSLLLTNDADFEKRSSWLLSRNHNSSPVYKFEKISQELNPCQVEVASPVQPSEDVSPRYCKDCKYFNNDTLLGAICLHPAAAKISLVWGPTKIACMTARDDQLSCGPTAALFAQLVSDLPCTKSNSV